MQRTTTARPARPFGTIKEIGCGRIPNKRSTADYADCADEENIRAIRVIRGKHRRVKAVRLFAHGAPGKMELGDVPDPKPGQGDVVVRVKACGLNHLDVWA